MSRAQYRCVYADGARGACWRWPSLLEVVRSSRRYVSPRNTHEWVVRVERVR